MGLFFNYRSVLYKCRTLKVESCAEFTYRLSSARTTGPTNFYFFSNFLFVFHLVGLLRNFRVRIRHTISQGGRHTEHIHCKVWVPHCYLTFNSICNIKIINEIRIYFHFMCNWNDLMNKKITQHKMRHMIVCLKCRLTTTHMWPSFF
jgi:hypothetical protein